MSETKALQVVEFDSSHVNDVLSLARQVLCDELRTHHDLAGEDDLQAIEASYPSPDSRFVVALSRGHVVGTGAIRRISDTDCELTRLYVQEDHRREGIASCIASELFKFVQQRGYRRVFLEIRPEMEQATRVIARYGFGDVTEAEDLPRPAKFMAIYFPDGA